MSSTSPLLPTARHSQYFCPLIGRTTSSRCHLSAALGRSRRITRPMLGFKAFHSAAATLAGIETAHMIRKRQLGESSLSAFRQFAGLAAKLCPKLWPAQPSKKFATETDWMGLSAEVNHRADALAFMHELERLVDLFQPHGVSDEIVQLEISVHIAINIVR
jgi:hypothetical protein